MSLWWLQPGWKSATCGHCGTNIWDAGGDPDHGLCPECWDQDYCGRHPEQLPFGAPKCDICGKHEAVTGVGKYGVCSEECHREAEGRIAKEKHETCS